MFGPLFALIILLFRAFLRLPIVPVKTNLRPTDAEVVGAMPTQAGIVNLINDLKANASPAFGNTTLATKSGITNTWSADEIVGGLIKRYGTQSSADLTATGTQICNAIPGYQVGQTFPLMVANLTSGTITPVAGTGVTLLGTTTVLRLSAKLFVGRITSSNAVSIESGFAFPVNIPD